MATPRYLTKLKMTELKRLSFLLGLPVTGRKSDCLRHLAHNIQHRPAPGEFSRILSIDMGIRNLAVCVLEAPYLDKAKTASAFRVSDNRKLAQLTVTAWQKVDVLHHLSIKQNLALSDSDNSDVEGNDVTRVRHPEGTTFVTADFKPGGLAEAAYALVSSLLSEHKPSAILIERQRFRTGGAAAITEWTVRVNLLEQAIWACLETLRAQSSSSPLGDNVLLQTASRIVAVREVSPAKVARFWCGHLAQDLEAEDDGGGIIRDWERASSKISKAEKVSVAQRWVDGWKADDGEHDNANLKFVRDAIKTANAFQSGRKKARRKKGEEKTEDIGKLDDLADCLLQAVAWVKWEENRRGLARVCADSPS